jgi:hypothetical protein
MLFAAPAAALSFIIIIPGLTPMFIPAPAPTPAIPFIPLLFLGIGGTGSPGKACPYLAIMASIGMLTLSAFVNDGCIITG